MDEQEDTMDAQSGERRRRMAVIGLAVGLGVLLGALAGPGRALAQTYRTQPAPPPAAGDYRAAPAPQAADPGIRGHGSMPDPGRRVEPRHRDGRRDGDHGRRDRDWHGRQYGGRYAPPAYYPYSYYPYSYYQPHWYPHYGYSQYSYGYYYPGTYRPGRWVWDGWNWAYVPY